MSNSEQAQGASSSPVESAVCCNYQNSGDNYEETEFLLSIPRSFLKDGSRDCLADDNSVQVELSSSPCLDRTDSESVDEQRSDFERMEDAEPDNSKASSGSYKFDQTKDDLMNDSQIADLHPVTMEPIPPGSDRVTTHQSTNSSNLASRPCGNFNCAIVCEGS